MSDAGAWYTVSIVSFGGLIRSETFTGGDALARADEFFARAGAAPDVAEIRLTRTDAGGSPKFVRRQGRERPGARLEWMTDIL